MPCAASPPRTFCQEKVVTSSLSHGRSIANAALVASQMVMPWRSSAIQSPFGTRTPDVVPFHRNTMSWSGFACLEIGQLAVIALCAMRASLIFSCLTVSVTQSSPKLSQAKTVDRPRPQQRPHRHLDRAGIGRRHDADAIIRRDARGSRACVSMASFSLALPGLERCERPRSAPYESFRRPTRPFGARSGRKKRPCRAHGRLDYRSSIIPSRMKRLVGEAWPALCIGRQKLIVNEEAVTFSRNRVSSSGTRWTFLAQRTQRLRKGTQGNEPHARHLRSVL